MRCGGAGAGNRTYVCRIGQNLAEPHIQVPKLAPEMQYFIHKFEQRHESFGGSYTSPKNGTGVEVPHMSSGTGDRNNY